MRDDHILTVNRVTFIADERFHSFYDATNGVWTLQVKYVGEQDNGYYECQVGTEPKLSAQILLNVIGMWVRVCIAWHSLINYPNISLYFCLKQCPGPK